MAHIEKCPFCDNAPPYYLARVTTTNQTMMIAYKKVMDENEALKKEIFKLKLKVKKWVI